MVHIFFLNREERSLVDTTIKLVGGFPLARLERTAVVT